jgi:hypothetical protein
MFLYSYSGGHYETRKNPIPYRRLISGDDPVINWMIFWNQPEGWRHPVNTPTWLMEALDQLGRGQFRQALKTINNALDAFWLKVAIRFGGAS